MGDNNIILNDSEAYFGTFSKVCTFCKYYIQGGEDYDNNIPGTCKAFPKGIPEEIWTGKNNHKKPYKGDHGIQFEKVD